MTRRPARLSLHLRPTRVPPLVPVLVPLARWAERSQRQACRNALVASTSLSQGRRERDEVTEYVETVLAHRAGDLTAGRSSGMIPGWPTAL